VILKMFQVFLFERMTLLRDIVASMKTFSPVQKCCMLKLTTFIMVKAKTGVKIKDKGELSVNQNCKI